MNFSLIHSGGGVLLLVIRLGIENFCYSIELEQWYLSTFCMSSVIIVYGGSSGQLEDKFDFSCNYTIDQNLPFGSVRTLRMAPMLSQEANKCNQSTLSLFLMRSVAFHKSFSLFIFRVFF